MKIYQMLIASLLIIGVTVYLYLKMFTNAIINNLFVDYLTFACILVCIMYYLNLIYNKKKGKNVKSRDKLFNSIVEKSDTVYIMMRSLNKKIVYLSSNVEDVLGISVQGKSEEQIVFEILNIPVLKLELDNWNKNEDYVSQMVEYVVPKYGHSIWIKIRLYTYLEKKNEYYILQIMNATKEHERQHLLITQASDIKNRESQLNEITADSYDVEININIALNTYDLKYFKKDFKYFGEEKSGNYMEAINSLANYINEGDREMFLNKLSLENLKEHFTKFELSSFTIRYRLGNEEKNNTWLESSIFFLSGRSSNRVSILTKNVTENAESIREQNVLLQNALNEARSADAAKTKLISTISHNIRTPLTNIMGLSEAMLTKKIDNYIKEDIMSIKESSNEMLEIIDEMVDTKKIGKELIKKEEKEYSVLKLFTKISDNLKEYVGTKPVKVNLNMDNNLPVILYGDSKRLTQLLTQVTNNAIKYTSEGKININVRGEKKENTVDLIIVVKDTGCGIDEKQIKSIIETDKYRGFNEIKKIINLLDGKFEIESVAGEYTKITIIINQKIVEDNKVRELMNKNQNAEIFELTGKRVLIVDDNKLNLKVTKKLLEPYKLDVTLLESGEECIDLIKEQNNFDLILLDQMMPGLSGLDTFNRLKEIKGFDIPVIALTADAISGQREKYLSSGFNDYISKPIDKSELSRILKEFIK